MMEWMLFRDDSCLRTSWDFRFLFSLWLWFFIKEVNIYTLLIRDEILRTLFRQNLKLGLCSVSFPFITKHSSDMFWGRCWWALKCVFLFLSLMILLILLEITENTIYCGDVRDAFTWLWMNHLAVIRWSCLSPSYLMYVILIEACSFIQFNLLLFSLQMHPRWWKWPCGGPWH